MTKEKELKKEMSKCRECASDKLTMPADSNSPNKSEASLDVKKSCSISNDITKTVSAGSDNLLPQPQNNQTEQNSEDSMANYPSKFDKPPQNSKEEIELKQAITKI